MEFTQTGTGAQPRTIQDKLEELPSVLDFIPESEHDAIVNGTSTLDVTSFVQTALNSRGRVYVPKGKYVIRDTLIMDKSYGGLVGDPMMPVFMCLPNTLSGTIKTAVYIKAAGAGQLNEFPRIQNMIFLHGDPDATPDTTNNPRPNYPVSPTRQFAAVALNGIDSWDPLDPLTIPHGVQRAHIYNIRFIGWPMSIHMEHTVNTMLERLYTENHSDWRTYNTGLTSSNKYTPYYFECNQSLALSQMISTQASAEVVHVQTNLDFAPTAVTCYGFSVVGSDPRDIFFRDCEVANGHYGFYLENTPMPAPATVSPDYNWNIHIIRPIIDQYWSHAIYAQGFKNAGCITILGGYGVREGDSSGGGNANAVIRLVECYNCYIGGGFQVLGVISNLPADPSPSPYTGRDEGIRLSGCLGCTIEGNVFIACYDAIILEDSSLCVVANNMISGSSGSLGGPIPALNYGISLEGNCNGNIVNSNVVRGHSPGVSPSTKYQVGIRIDSGVDGNRIMGNAVEVSTVVTPYDLPDPGINTNNNGNFLDGPTIVPFEDYQIVGVEGLVLRSQGGTMKLVAAGGGGLPNKAFSFNVPTGTGLGAFSEIAFINTAGAYTGSDERLKDNIELLGPALQKLANIQAKTFTFKSDTSDQPAKNIGLIAQEVIEEFPEVVGETREGFYALNYSALVPVLINAINELAEKVRILEEGQG